MKRRDCFCQHSALRRHMPAKSHGQSTGKNKSRAYVSWNCAKTRCYNKNSKYYKYYGGRGIRMSPKWVNSFETFYKDMGERPIGCSLDRIDSDGDYSFENCRWSTHKQQMNNTRSNILLKIGEETKSLKEWADFYGVNYLTANWRYHNGLPLEKIFQKEYLPKSSHIIIEYNGERKPLREWAKVLGLKYTTARYRLINGYRIDEVLSSEPLRRGPRES